MITTTSARPASAWLTRRIGLVVPVILVAVSVALLIGSATMVVPTTAAPPGPRVFPLIIAVGTLVVAVLLAIDLIRNPEPQYTRIQAGARGIDDGRTETVPALGAAGLDEIAIDGDESTPLRPRSNVRALLGALGTIVVFIAALQPLGWLISAAFAFWGVSRALGSRRPVFDVFVGFGLSAAVQLAFSAGLGLHLPPGILEGVLSWIR